MKENTKKENRGKVYKVVKIEFENLSRDGHKNMKMGKSKKIKNQKTYMVQ